MIAHNFVRRPDTGTTILFLRVASEKLFGVVEGNKMNTTTIPDDGDGLAVTCMSSGTAEKYSLQSFAEENDAYPWREGTEDAGQEVLARLVLVEEHKIVEDESKSPEQKDDMKTSFQNPDPDEEVPRKLLEQGEHNDTPESSGELSGSLEQVRKKKFFKFFVSRKQSRRGFPRNSSNRSSEVMKDTTGSPSSTTSTEPTKDNAVKKSKYDDVINILAEHVASKELGAGRFDESRNPPESQHEVDSAKQDKYQDVVKNLVHQLEEKHQLDDTVGEHQDKSPKSINDKSVKSREVVLQQNRPTGTPRRKMSFKRLVSRNQLGSDVVRSRELSRMYSRRSSKGRGSTVESSAGKMPLLEDKESKVEPFAEQASDMSIEKESVDEVHLQKSRSDGSGSVERPDEGIDATVAVVVSCTGEDQCDSNSASEGYKPASPSLVQMINGTTSNDSTFAEIFQARTDGGIAVADADVTMSDSDSREVGSDSNIFVPKGDAEDVEWDIFPRRTFGSTSLEGNGVRVGDITFTASNSEADLTASNSLADSIEDTSILLLEQVDTLSTFDESLDHTLESGHATTERNILADEFYHEDGVGASHTGKFLVAVEEICIFVDDNDFFCDRYGEGEDGGKGTNSIAD